MEPPIFNATVFKKDNALWAVDLVMRGTLEDVITSIGALVAQAVYQVFETVQDGKQAGWHAGNMLLNIHQAALEGIFTKTLREKDKEFNEPFPFGVQEALIERQEFWQGKFAEQTKQ